MTSNVSKWDWETIVDPTDLSPMNVYSETSLRQICAYSVAANLKIEPLKTIAFVGGIFVDYDNSQNNITNRDTYYLTKSLLYLIRSGIPVSPDFSVHLSNLIYHEDYLQTDYASDIVILGYIPSYGVEDLLASKFLKDIGFATFKSDDAQQNHIRTLIEDALIEQDFKRVDDYSHQLGGIISPVSNQESWRNRLAAARPKIVLSFGGGGEIKASKLGSESLLNPVADPIQKIRNIDRIIGAEAEFKEADRIYRGWEILVDKAFLHRAASHVWNFTMLGQHMQASAGLCERPAIVDPSASRFRESGFDQMPQDRWVPRPPYAIPYETRNDYHNPTLTAHWKNIPRPWKSVLEKSSPSG